VQRLLFLITELDIGGAEKTLYELVRRLDRRQFEPAVACLTGRGPIGEWLEKEGIRVFHIGMNSWWDLPAWFRLRRILKEQRPHVLHTFLFHANLAGRLAAIASGVRKVICSVRVEEPRRGHLWADRLTRGLADVVTCVSESARRYTHKHARTPLSKLVVIPNGIDPAACDAPMMAAPEEWRLPPDVPVVGVIGRLDEQKDPLLMLRAAAQVLQQVPQTVFAFAGSGLLAASCRAAAEKLGIAEHIRWLGWIEDTRPLLARMNLLALSSRWEGMPNVVLEAMACRKPVVATSVGGCPEMIVDGKTGFLVPPADEHALASRISRLLLEPAVCAKLANAARAHVDEKFSILSMVRANQQLYM